MVRTWLRVGLRTTGPIALRQVNGWQPTCLGGVRRSSRSDLQPRVERTLTSDEMHSRRDGHVIRPRLVTAALESTPRTRIGDSTELRLEERGMPTPNFQLPIPKGSRSCQPGEKCQDQPGAPTASSCYGWLPLGVGS